MAYEEKTVKENYIFKGKIVSLRCDDALLPNGKLCTREVVEHNGGACVLYVEEGKILFVKQYRYAYREEVLEIPAGKLEKGEDPALAAKRELEEEAGVKAEKLTLLFVLYPTPGYNNEKIYIYRAIGGERVPAHLDEDEFLDILWIDEEEVRGMLARGEINDAKTLVALQHYFLHG